MKKWLGMLMMAGLLTSSAFAGDRLTRSLDEVPSDSMVVWGGDRSDMITAAQSFLKKEKLSDFAFAPLSNENFRRQVEDWEESTRKLNILGGLETADAPMDILGLENYLQLSAGLFLQTGHVKYMNVIERAALNQLLLTLQPKAENSFDTYHAAKILAGISNLIYTTDDKGVYVNLFLNNSTHICTKELDLVMDQLTGMPHSNRVKLRVGGLEKGQTHFILRLRMPDWTYRQTDYTTFSMTEVPEKLPVVYVNGREEFYRMEKGYLVIDRKWNTGDEVYLDFPFETLQLQLKTKQKGAPAKVALQRGPLVYGFSHPMENWGVTLPWQVCEQEQPNDFGHSVLTLPVKNPSGSQEKVLAEPVMDGKGNLWLSVEK